MNWLDPAKLALPSFGTSKGDAVDYFELECLKQADSTVSMEDLRRILTKDSEDPDSSGVEQDERIARFVEDVVANVDRRSQYCEGTSYPFVLENNGALLRFGGIESDSRRLVYIFLLISATSNMNTQHTHAGMDCRQLFEELCACAAMGYLGAGAYSHVFGTSNQVGTFESKINTLCEALSEGAGFRNNYNHIPPSSGDDNLDVVAWREFPDKEQGKVILFGQCKTGNGWRSGPRKIDPGDFGRSWFKTQLPVSPTPSYCVTQQEDHRPIAARCSDLGVFFNRSRIVSYAKDLPPSLHKRLSKWVTASRKAHKL